MIEILNNVSFPWKDIIKDVKFMPIKKEWKDRKTVEGIKWSLIPQFPACQTVDITQYLNLTGKETPQYVYLEFNKVENLRMTVTIEDRLKMLSKRTLKSNTIDFEGPRIQIDDLMSPQYLDFYLTVSQTISLETDEGMHCQNYPTKEFESFSECDQHFVYNEMKNRYNVMPFWAAKKLDEITKIM